MDKKIKEILELMVDLSLEQVGDFIEIIKETNITFDMIKKEKYYKITINEDVALALENLHDLLMSIRKEIK